MKAPDGSMPAPANRRLWPFGLVALIVGVFVVFSPALRNGFVWDDRPLLLENWDNLGFSLPQIRWAFSSFHMGHYQPLTWLSFSMDHAIWGDNPLGFHLTNIILHAANTAIFATIAFSLLRTARQPRGDWSDKRIACGALVAAALFALHPLRVESVAWVTERRDVLSGLFFLVSVQTYMQAVHNGTNGRLHGRWRAASVAAFCLSLLSKSLGVGLPIVLIVLDRYPLRRRTPIGKSVAEKIPYLILAGLTVIIAVIAQAQVGALISGESHTVTARLAQAAYGIVFYLKATFASLAWYPLHERPWKLDPTELRFVVSAGVVLLTTATLLLLRRRFPAGLVAWVCYIVLLLPMLGLAQSGVQLVADRYSYLSCMTWAVLVGAVAAGALHRRALGVGVVAILCFLSALTWRQTRIWHDEESLWRHALGAGPSCIAHNNLGVIDRAAGDTASAIDQFALALKVVPTYPTARSNLIGLTATLDVESDSATLARARDALARSLQHGAVDAPAWTALGKIEAALNHQEQAIACYERALSANPKNADTWRHLGLARLAEKDAAGAIDAYHRAVALDPDLGEAWLSLGIGLVMERRFDDARPAFETATRLLPDSSSAWTGLGVCRLQARDLDGAATALQQAVTLDPANTRATKMLSVIQQRTTPAGSGNPG